MFSVVNLICIQNGNLLSKTPSIMTHSHASFLKGSNLVKLILTLLSSVVEMWCAGPH